MCKPLPPLTPAQSVGHRTSTLGLTLTVPTSTVESMLAKYVPETVAEDRNVSAGVAGRVSYVIKRGKPKLETRESGVRATVELTGDIHVCKPFGGACFEYGVCHPEWTAKLDLRAPWQLADEPDVDLDVEVTRGCILSPVKFDATAELEKITRAEVRKIEKRLNHEIHAFHRVLRKRLGKVDPLRITKNTCVAASLDSVALDVERESKHYAVAIETKGLVTLDCNTHRDSVHPSTESERAASGTLTPAGTPPGPPPDATPDGTSAAFTDDPPALLTERTRITAAPKLTPGTDLHLTSQVSMSTLTQEWQASFPHHQVRVTPSSNALLVEVSGWQGCDAGWALLRPSFVQGSVGFTPLDASDPNLVAMLQTPRALNAAAAEHARSIADVEHNLRAPIHAESEFVKEDLEVRLNPALTKETGLQLAPNAVVLQTTLRGTVTGNVVVSR